MNLIGVLSSGILLMSFLLVASKRIITYIGIFRFQSILLAILAFVIGVEEYADKGTFDVLIVGSIILLVKVFYIPRQLNKTFINIKYVVQKDFFMNIPLLVLMCSVIVLISYFTVSSIDTDSLLENTSELVNSVSVILIGLFFMISRKKAIGQIIGFLVLENGIFLTALLSTGGMPLIVDIGVFVDLLTAVFMMGFLIFRINEEFNTTDTNALNNLRG